MTGAADAPGPDDAAPRGAGIGEAERLQLLVDAVEEYAIFVLDPDGTVASWNSGAQRIKGYTADEIIGRSFSVFYPPADVAAGKPERGLAAAEADGQYSEEGVRVRKDGSIFWAHVVITAMRDGAGRLNGFAKVTRDETARRAADSAARAARLEAERANAAKSTFLSRMSHELRTPLNSILGFGRLLQLDRLGDDQQRNVSQILNAGTHLLGLIDEVLDITKMESGVMRVSLEPVGVADVVDEAIAMLQPAARRRNVSMRSHAVDRHTFVRADRQRLKQVLVNLLSNAVKYNHDGGTVDVDGGAGSADRWRITVRDNGRGIPDADLDRLFQPFERLNADQSDVEGTGLGLALSRSLMTAMGGEIGVAPGRGVGSAFWIELPGAPTPHTDRDVADAAPPPAAAHLAAPRRTVLYVEDNLSNVRLLERIAARTPNVTLMVAMQGRLAIELALEHRPDLILLDLHLPDVSGEEVLRCLRADRRTATTPVVVMSADATPTRPGELRTMGADDFITKPFDVDAVLTLLRGPADDATGESEHDHGRVEAEARATTPAAVDVSVPAEGPSLEDFVHDLNNVLGIILNYCTLLTRTCADEQTRADLDQIRVAAERGVSMARRLRPPR